MLVLSEKKQIKLHPYEVNNLRELLKWCRGDRTTAAPRTKRSPVGKPRTPMYLDFNLKIVEQIIKQADEQSYVGS